MVEKTIKSLGGKIVKHKIISKDCCYLNTPNNPAKQSNIFIDARSSYNLNVDYKSFTKSTKIDIKNYLKSRGMINHFMALVDAPAKLSKYAVFNQKEWLKKIENSSNYGGRIYTNYTSASDFVNGLKEK
jgi:hypothetical protein